MNQKLVPVRAVLVKEEDWLSRRTHSGTRARSLYLHQGNKAVHLGLLRSQFSQDAPQTQRFLTECGPEPVVAGSSSIAFIEDKIDDLKNRRQTRGKLCSARNFKRNMLLSEGTLCPDDTLCDRRLGDKKRTCNLFGGQ